MSTQRSFSIQQLPATRESVEQLIALTTLLGYAVTPDQMMERLTKINARKDHHFLVAKKENEILGFCHGYVRLLTEVDTAVEIGGLAVSESSRGKGVGRALVEGIELWAKSIGIPFLVLSSNIIRTEAHKFYEHLGYTKSRQQFAYEKRLK